MQINYEYKTKLYAEKNKKQKKKHFFWVYFYRYVFRLDLN